MAMKTCKECGKEISSSAKTCPSCGKKQGMGCLKIGLIVIGGFFLLGVIGQLLGGGKGSSSSGGNATTSTSTTSEQTAPSKEYITESCSQLARQFSAQGKMSDLQKKEAWKIYENKWVKWSAKVSSVSETFGTLQVQVKCQPDTLVSDAIIAFDDSFRAKLLQLSEGQSITFEARLNDYNQLIGLSLQDGDLK